MQFFLFALQIKVFVFVVMNLLMFFSFGSDWSDLLRRGYKLLFDRFFFFFFFFRDSWFAPDEFRSGVAFSLKIFR